MEIKSIMLLISNHFPK